MTYNLRLPSAAFLTLLALAVHTASPAYAICEPPGVAAGAAGTAAGTNTAALTAAQTTMMTTGMTTILTTMQTPINLSLEKMEKDIFDSMSKFWESWDTGLRALTAQVSAAGVDQSLKSGQIADAKGVSNAALILQVKEAEAVKDNQPSLASCRYDTIARFSKSSGNRVKGVSNALATDLNKMGSNHKGTPAAGGAAPVQNVRWQNYVTKFCDPNANGKKAGCTQPGTDVGADIQPSKTIFMRDTINLGNKDRLLATQELVMNVTGYKVPDPIDPKVLKKSSGREQRQSNRAYLAKMDAAGALVNTLIAERTPGETSPEIQALRMRLGLTACKGDESDAINCASPTPSAKEIRQARIEELRDPNYYSELTDKGSLQKEVLLDAYNVTLLYNLIERMEKISNIYAIETAGLLNKVDNSRGSSGSSLPVNPGGAK